MAKSTCADSSVHNKVSQATGWPVKGWAGTPNLHIWQTKDQTGNPGQHRASYEVTRPARSSSSVAATTGVHPSASRRLTVGRMRKCFLSSAELLTTTGYQNRIRALAVLCFDKALLFPPQKSRAQKLILLARLHNESQSSRNDSLGGDSREPQCGRRTKCWSNWWATTGFATLYHGLYYYWFFAQVFHDS